MINISELKTRLTRLCNGTCSRGDVDYVVEILRKEAEKYLATRLFKLKKSASPDAYRKTLTDNAWDLIGPLLGRNPSGRFLILNEYFGNFRDVSEADYFTAFNKFIFTRFHSEFIKQIEETDGFGKAFERTLTYLLRKHPHWNKIDKGRYRTLTGAQCT
ncbi:MAG: hypothetical protein GXO91_01990, partial [FCB group bacterium]|nr:hypothetical protein [FCB group bacterium]